MAFPDQARKFLGRNVRVDTVEGTFTGRLVRVNSTTIILRHREDRNRIIIRDAQIIAVTELRDCC